MINKHKAQQFVDLNATGDKAAFCFPKAAEILEVNLGVIGTDAGGATVKFDSLLAGTRGDGDIAELTVPAANNAGQVLQEIPATLKIVQAGTVVVVEVTAESLSGATTAVVEIVWKDLGVYNANSDNVDSA